MLRETTVMHDARQSGHRRMSAVGYCRHTHEKVYDEAYYSHVDLLDSTNLHSGSYMLKTQFTSLFFPKSHLI
jgi:hypothetical protein